LARLPDERTLMCMTDLDIESMNTEIDEAISQCEDHVKRDNNSIIMLREQTAIMARIVHEQQLHICDLNERLLLKLEAEKEREREDDMLIQNDIFDLGTIMTWLQESLKKRQELVSKVFAPIDFRQIKSTMTKLKSALISINVLNTQFVKRNNSLTLQLSMVPANVREQITQAILSHSPIATNQREHPHCLVPDRETKYVFRRSDPNDPMAEELQRGNHFSSVQHLLNEVQDVMNIIRNYDASVGVDEGIDEVEQGPNLQTAMNNGEQKGANKHSHATMVVPGHRVHTSRTENISTAADGANLAALQSVSSTARIRTIQDVAVPASQSSSSIPVAQATTATAQVIHLIDPTVRVRLKVRVRFV
jgi:hypothetical protein